MRKKYVIFDMDGVLLDSEAGSFRFTRDILEKRGIHVELNELMGNIGKTSRQVAEEIIENHHIPETVDEFLQKNREMGNYYADSKELKVMPGLYEFLEYLKEKSVKMAVVSSTRAAGVLFALNRLSLVSYMDAIVSGDMVKKPKPEAEGYLQAAHCLNARPEECIVFEDSPIGIRAAKKAGMNVVGFKGSELKQDTSEADREVTSFGECIREISKILEI